MKLYLVAFGVIVLVVFGAAIIQFDIITPPLIAREMARAAPWAAQKITQWTFRFVTDHYEGDDFAGDEGAWEGAAAGSDPYGVGVYNGGTVEFLDAVVEDTAAVCQIPTTRLTDCYSVPRPGYMDHSGIDYGMDENTPVSATISGVVTYAAWSPHGYGYLVVIESNGVQIYLGHLNEMYVEVGQTVAAGEIVALSGNTGNSSGAHLHFEVRQCDETGQCSVVDPNSVILPGQQESCDWYFGQQIDVHYQSGFAYSCGIEGFELLSPP